MRKLYLTAWILLFLNSYLLASNSREEEIAVGIICTIFFLITSTIYYWIQGNKSKPKEIIDDVVPTKIEDERVSILNSLNDKLIYISYSPYDEIALNTLLEVEKRVDDTHETSMLSVEYLPMGIGVNFEFIRKKRSKEQLNDLLKFNYSLADQDVIDGFIDGVVEEYDDLLRNLDTPKNSDETKYFVKENYFVIAFNKDYKIVVCVEAFKNGGQSLEERLSNNLNLDLSDIDSMRIEKEDIYENFEEEGLFEIQGNPRLTGAWKVENLLVEFKNYFVKFRPHTYS